MDGRTDGRTDGWMDGRTDNHPNSDISSIPKLVLIPTDAISVEKKIARTDRVKPIWPSDYRQAGNKKCQPVFSIILHDIFLAKRPHVMFREIRKKSEMKSNSLESNRPRERPIPPDLESRDPTMPQQKWACPHQTHNPFDDAANPF